MTEKRITGFKRKGRSVTKAMAALVVAVFAANGSSAAEGICAAGEIETTVLVVRHAEKTCRRCDELSEEGLHRARALPAAVGKITDRLTAVYHSDTKRTRQTVAHLDPKPHIEYARNSTEGDLVAEIFEDRCGQDVLVAGHSNTVPKILEFLGVPPGQIDAGAWFPATRPDGVREIDHKDHDDLFVVKRCGPCGEDGRSILMHRNYGATTTARVKAPSVP